VVRPFHNVLAYIFRSLMEVPTVSFANFSSAIFLKIMTHVLSILRRFCSFGLGPLFHCCIPGASIL
jgi:hypothetical protein